MPCHAVPAQVQVLQAAVDAQHPSDGAAAFAAEVVVLEVGEAQGGVNY
jgi:hypothetical protein